MKNQPTTDPTPHSRPSDLFSREIEDMGVNIWFVDRDGRPVEWGKSVLVLVIRANRKFE